MLDVRLLVGLKAHTPQHTAGYLISPNTSTPKPIPTEKVLTKPASPPQEPPVLKSFLIGWIALPQIELLVSFVKQPPSINPAA